MNINDIQDDEEFCKQKIRMEVTEEIETDLHQKYLKAMRETVESLLNADDLNRALLIQDITNDFEQKYLRAMKETVRFITTAKDREVALQGVSYALLTKSSKKMSMREKALELGELGNGKDKKSVLSRHKIAYTQMLSDLNNSKDINQG